MITYTMENKPTTTINEKDDTTKQEQGRRYKSPSTRGRAWRRAIAWRRQMGLLPEADREPDAPPSLVATDVVQQRYLQLTEDIEVATHEGEMDSKFAQHLKRELLNWTIFQISLMRRIEELEVDIVQNEGEHSGREEGKCNELEQALLRRFPHRKYDTTKCEMYIKPVPFISRGKTVNDNKTDTDIKTESSDETKMDIKETTNDQPTDETNGQTDMHKGGPGRQHTTYDMNYAMVEENMRLARLENEKNLNTALRLVTRTLHPQGQTICFPQSEQTDRMILKTDNLPTDGTKLCDLLRKVFTRRGEVFDIDKTWRDFAKAYGRVYFEWSNIAKGKDAYVYTRYS